MTEERIIINYAIIERTFDKAGDAKAQWLMIRAISDPAPPTSWRPVCYSGWHGEPCGGRFIELGSRLIRPECEGCPYHKMESKSTIRRLMPAINEHIDPEATIEVVELTPKKPVRK